MDKDEKKNSTGPLNEVELLLRYNERISFLEKQYNLMRTEFIPELIKTIRILEDRIKVLETYLLGPSIRN